MANVVGHAAEVGPIESFMTEDHVEEAARLVGRLRAQPEVPQAKYYDGPLHRRQS